MNDDRWLIAWFVFLAVLSLAILGVVLWGFIETVSWVTAQ